MTLSNRVLLQKDIVQDLKVQWRRLWCERVDIRWKAEGIANQTYPMLFVERGTVIHATRDFKTFSFKEILELNQIKNLARYSSPDPEISGWTKFVKTQITLIKKQHSCDYARARYLRKVERNLRSLEAKKGKLEQLYSPLNASNRKQSAALYDVVKASGSV